ncbi:hypothetical protein [Roseisolibacter agri]|uniref:Uncharacterized protein n=1 Tax=Roseisolibacter agri TaxID=2014610 RepID=A0AA37VET6_9BACT|nr:hypothetical protein [Roseisolibacter agri]GLC25754.1 hypothetical protein rosag_22670 [Roseisolibacter agri]
MLASRLLAPRPLAHAAVAIVVGATVLLLVGTLMVVLGVGAGGAP